jgi:hypothetical protein
MTQDTAADGVHEGLPPPTQVFWLTLIEVTSVLVVTIRQRRRVSASSFEELHRFYRSVLVHNLCLGWWGFPFGLIWTPVAIVQNARARSKLSGLMSEGAADPGWYKDPTGHHQTRYWDGTKWTDQVSDTQVSTDPPRPA